MGCCSEQCRLWVIAANVGRDGSLLSRGGGSVIALISTCEREIAVNQRQISCDPLQGARVSVSIDVLAAHRFSVETHRFERESVRFEPAVGCMRE